MFKTIFQRMTEIATVGAVVVLLSTAVGARSVQSQSQDSVETFVFRVDEPNVNQHATSYPQHTFRVGDRVQINAGGCVQTGGSGKTWKRYVNPEGPGADQLYHGLISIPGATQGLTRLDGLVGAEVVVSSLPRPFLMLGYEDDDFSDNGYWGHDDGTNDQCRGLGNAYVELTVFRQVPRAVRPTDPSPIGDATNPTSPPRDPTGDPVAQSTDANPRDRNEPDLSTTDTPFFETLPGIITAIAGLITAVAGAIVVFRTKK